MGRRRRKTSAGRLVGRVLTAVLALPALYLTAALIGSLVPVNRGWNEPAQGTTVYIADNGIHADIIMPVKADGLDWTPLVPKSDFAAADPECAMDCVRLGRGAGLSEHANVVGHHAPHDLVGARRRQAGDARRICAEPVLRSARDPAEAGGVSAAVGCDPRGFRARRARKAAASRASGLRLLRRILPGDRQGERGAHVQQLARGSAAARRREGERVAAVHSRAWCGVTGGRLRARSG